MTLTQRFLNEIGCITEPELFAGVARILKVNLMEDKDTPRKFADVFADTMKAYDTAGRKRKKELLKILHEANLQKISTPPSKEVDQEGGDSNEQ